MRHTLTLLLVLSLITFTIRRGCAAQAIDLTRIFHEKSTAATVNQSWTALQKKKWIRRMYNTPSSLFSSAVPAHRHPGSLGTQPWLLPGVRGAAKRCFGRHSPCPGLIYSHLATISHEICGLGIYGTIFPIEEIDMRVIIKQQLRAINWEKKQTHLIQQSTHWADNLPTANLPTAHKTTCQFIDPSVHLKKGRVINPIDSVRPHKALLFIDGEHIAQRQLAYDLWKQQPQALMVVFAKGNPIKFSHQIQQRYKMSFPVYYAFPKLIQRFHIQHLPALLSVGKYTHKRALALITLALPSGSYHFTWQRLIKKMEETCYSKAHNL